jgi:hypothetical protein
MPWILRKNFVEFAPSIRKGDQTIEIWLREKTPEWTIYAPDSPWLRGMNLYVPSAIIKIRKHSPEVNGPLDAIEEVPSNIYGAAMRIQERLSNWEWAMIGSIYRRQKSCHSET